METPPKDFALSGVKALDFTGVLGPYAGKMFAGLGADVIHVESPPGDPLRRVGPFYHHTPGRENSLPFQYYNAGKRGLVLDLTKDQGRKIFRELCQKADILLESTVPGYLDGLGLSYRILRQDNSKLVQTSITPFGTMGPYKKYPGSDLTISSLGGFLYLAGVDNDKPVRVPDDQSYRMAEAYAAVGGLIALYDAAKTGQGQFVDVACVEAVGMALENAIQYYDLEGKIRRGRGREAGTATIHPCQDGYIALVAIMGKNKVMWDPFVAWMKSENVAGWEEFDSPKWIDPGYRSSKEGYQTFCRIFESYTMKHDKLYLYEKGQAHRTAVSPVSNGQDLLENPQLAHNQFWKKLYHAELGGEVTYPGPPYELGDSDWTLGAAAPTFGQHTAEILAELGYSPDAIQALAKEGVVYVG